VEVHESPAVRLLKSTDHFPRRLLGIHAHPRTPARCFETKS
jgi:hypothetical protein